MSNRAILLKVL